MDNFFSKLLKIVDLVLWCGVRFRVVLLELNKNQRTFMKDEWMKDNGITILSLSSFSPNMNPIESV